MLDWKYQLWSEDNFDLSTAPRYVQEAYEGLDGCSHTACGVLMPVLTTGENLRCERTYCEHKGLHSWSRNGGWKAMILNLLGQKWKTILIKLKRKIIG